MKGVDENEGEMWELGMAESQCASFDCVVARREGAQSVLRPRVRE